MIRRARKRVAVIPTLILFGLIFGRWWRFSLIAAAIGLPVVLVVGDVMAFEWGLVGAAGLAVANTLVGVLAHQGVRWVVRQVRHRHAAPKIS
jgi:hypothetical protein